MKIIKFLKSGALSVVVFAMTAQSVFAGAESFGINEENFLTRIYQITVAIGVAVGFILIGLGGLTIATATGNPDKIQKGRDQIISALVGLAVVLFAAAVLGFFGDILGLGNNFFNNSGF